MESWRVAQIVVERGPGGAGSRGSGYLVAPGLVLTAAHVVAGASAVRVRLDVGQPAEVEVLAEGLVGRPCGAARHRPRRGHDPRDATAGREVEPARFGRISDGTAVLAVQAFGFPRFKLRGDAAESGGPGVFRDLEQVTGHAPVAANRRQGTLAVYLDDPPPAAPEPGGPSPWAGMSGAAVWADGRIVAVVAEHHPGEGTGRLTARRIDRAYDQLPEPDLGRLVDWLGLAPAIGGLPDVVPAGPGQLVRSAYLEQVRDIAPDDADRPRRRAGGVGRVLRRPARPTPGGRPGRGPVRPRWRRGSSPIPRPGWTSCRSSSPAAWPARPTATHSWTP